MLNESKKFTSLLFCVFALSFTHCGAAVDSTTTMDGSSKTAVVLDVDLENDADNDNVYMPCDSDDSNANNTSILSECDEDDDGYVDTACTTYTDDNGVFSEEHRLEIGVNCDLCPGSNFEQVDDDQDGVGDSCNLDIGGADIDINAPIS